MIDCKSTSSEALVSLMANVGDRLLDWDMSSWFWGDAIGIDGLIEASELTGDRQFLQRPLGWCSAWADRILTSGPVPTDHMAAGGAAIRLAELTGTDRLLDAARVLATYLMHKVPRTKHGIPLYRPDLPDYRHTIWVDTLYHEPSFFGRLYLATGETHFADYALKVIDDHRKALWNSELKLFPQAIDTATRAIRGTGWGRGQGWALLGYADLYEMLRHTAYGETMGPLSWELADRVVGLQDFTGFWHTLIHDRESYLETSTATFFAAALFKLARLGEARYCAAADLALTAMLNRIDTEGTVWGVSAVTWAATTPGSDIARYKTCPTEPNVWGQGSALRALGEALRFRQGVDEGACR